LKRTIGVAMMGRNFFDNEVKKRGDILILVVGLES
jgi:hypothetical protein